MNGKLTIKPAPDRFYPGFSFVVIQRNDHGFRARHQPLGNSPNAIWGSMFLTRQIRTSMPERKLAINGIYRMDKSMDNRIAYTGRRPTQLPCIQVDNKRMFRVIVTIKIFNGTKRIISLHRHFQISFTHQPCDNDGRNIGKCKPCLAGYLRTENIISK